MVRTDLAWRDCLCAHDCIFQVITDLGHVVADDLHAMIELRLARLRADEAGLVRLPRLGVDADGERRGLANVGRHRCLVRLPDVVERRDVGHHRLVLLEQALAILAAARSVRVLLAILDALRLNDGGVRGRGVAAVAALVDLVARNDLLHRERLLAAKLAGLDAHRLNLFRCGERPARAALLLVLHRGGEVASPIVRGGGVETLRLELVAVRWEAEGDDGRKER